MSWRRATRKAPRIRASIVKFPLRDQPGVYLLVWTTTPWTLPGNVAVAVGEEIDYVLVQHEDDKLWLAEALLGSVFGSTAGDVTVLRRAKGRELLGWHYRPLYTFLSVTPRLLLHPLRRFRQYGGWHGPGAHRAGLRR